MPRANKYHIDLSLLPEWQQAYIQQYRRVHNEDAGFTPRPNGWFQLHRADRPNARVFCYREGDIRQMTEELEGESRYQASPAAPVVADVPLGVLIAQRLRMAGGELCGARA